MHRILPESGDGQPRRHAPVGQLALRCPTVARMTEPWLGDACSLVDSFRKKELSPLEALDASLAALDRSALNAVSHRDDEAARSAAAVADVSLPFGGVAIGVKELEQVAGWPLN